jgi:hypothetical protein
VQRGLDGTFVYRVRDGQVDSVPVTVIDQTPGLSVLEGVATGDTLVSDGQSRLKPGSTVEVLSGEPAAPASAPEGQP